MATKGKDKILDGQIAFDFMAELEVVAPKKARKPKVTIETEKPIKAIIKNIFRKQYINIKPNHLKKNRKVRKIKRRN